MMTCAIARGLYTSKCGKKKKKKKSRGDNTSANDSPTYYRTASGPAEPTPKAREIIIIIIDYSILQNIFIKNLFHLEIKR